MQVNEETTTVEGDEAKLTPQTSDITQASSIDQATSSLNVDKWAIVVGISKYQHEKWNLEWAHREPLMIGADPEELLFSNSIDEAKIQENLQRISDEPLKGIVRRLGLLLEKRPDLRVSGHLDLGIANSVLGKFELEHF